MGTDGARATPNTACDSESPPNFAPWAEACGGRGIKVDKAADIEAALEEAFDYPGPALVDVYVNPDEPPMPGKVEYEQAKGFVKAFLNGQPRKATIASTLWRDKITELRAKWQHARPRTAAPLIGIDRLLRNVRHGRFERSLAALTAVGAVITGLEIWLEHDRASFANRMMWIPVALTPAIAAAGVAGVVSRRAAKTVLPVASAVVLANSLQGQYLHLRGIAQRPGRLADGPLQRGDGPADVRAAALRSRRAAWVSWPRSFGVRTERRARHRGRRSSAFPATTSSHAFGRLGRHDDSGRPRPARACRSRRSSSTKPKRRSSASSSTGCWPRTTSRGCPSSRSSTGAWLIGDGDGYRYDDMPEDPEAWRRSVAALDADARRSCRPAASPTSTTGPARHHRAGPAVRGGLARPAGRASVLALDALRLRRLLRPSLGVERDRLRRPGLPDRLQAPRPRRPRALGGPRA